MWAWSTAESWQEKHTAVIGEFTKVVAAAGVVTPVAALKLALAEAAALKSKVPGEWQVSHFARMPGYPICQNPSVAEIACHVSFTVRNAAAWIEWTNTAESPDQPLLFWLGL